MIQLETNEIYFAFDASFHHKYQTSSFAFLEPISENEVLFH